MSEDHKEKRQPGAVMSFLVFGAAIAVLLLGVVLLDYDIHIVLLCALTVVCIASVPLGYSFMDLVDCMKKSLGQALAAMIIFIFIGIIISSLIFSGTVPALIYYGLQYIIPDYFLPIGLLLCSLTSISIGTSWGTVGTMGLAMMGIGAGMGIPAPLTAGMVISGHFSEIRCHPYQTAPTWPPQQREPRCMPILGLCGRLPFLPISLLWQHLQYWDYPITEGISAWIL